MKKHKLSYYTIFTKSIDNNGNLIVFSSRSGKTMKLPQYTANLLLNGQCDLLSERQREALVKCMIIVPADEVELNTVISENKKEVFEKKHTLYEAIQPSANCQLGCYYCGQQHTKSNLSDEIANKIVDRIVHKFQQGNYKDIFLGWFGGEPLMGLPQMRKINTQLREKLKGVTIGSKITTNGLSLKENIYWELVNDFKVRQIEVTLDGVAEHHDTHRYTKSGGKSFDIIYKNLQKILSNYNTSDQQSPISIRCNVDESNINGVEPLIDLLAKDGLHQKISHLYFAPIYSWAGNDAHKKSLTREEMGKKQIEWDIRMVKLGYPVLSPFPARSKAVCLAVGDTGEMYDAYGNVFNCTEASYTDHYDGTSYQLGNLKDDHLATFTNKPHNDWNDKVKDSDEYPCHSCKMFPSCGGACPKSWAEGNVACPIFKYNLRSSLELRYMLKTVPEVELLDKLNEFESELSLDDFQRMESHMPNGWDEDNASSIGSQPSERLTF